MHVVCCLYEKVRVLCGVDAVSQPGLASHKGRFWVERGSYSPWGLCGLKEDPISPYVSGTGSDVAAQQLCTLGGGGSRWEKGARHRKEHRLPRSDLGSRQFHSLHGESLTSSSISCAFPLGQPSPATLLTRCHRQLHSSCRA
ncbi:hypothetical protein EGM_07238 [Macaca fascicularis]|uniref:Uncharacterized protein n=1 Tax=Macaca fascicularis TaxID=9541 RepID=G7PT06_MACFA|nr:hypothetical protein EGM_07238 [Macaca fascicularis]